MLLHDKPVEGVRVSLGEKGTALATDAQGLVTVRPVAGSNQLLGQQDGVQHVSLHVIRTVGPLRAPMFPPLA